MTTVALLIGREPEHRYSMYRGYADAVWAAGGTPITLIAPTSAQHVPEYVRAVLSCDAVCITGGGDVDPTRYGAPVLPGLLDVDTFRDAAEIEAVRAATVIERPVLGICRGIQVISVACGGSLHQDLPTAGYEGHWDEDRQYQPVHALNVVSGSSAEAALGGATEVNSIHHQAVRDPGPELTVTATSIDGVIEAVERPGVLGVQWHPERLWAGDVRHLAPFTWLLEETRKVASRPSLGRSN